LERRDRCGSECYHTARTNTIARQIHVLITIRI
jgi:hypothetical protein